MLEQQIIVRFIQKNDVAHAETLAQLVCGNKVTDTSVLNDPDFIAIQKAMAQKDPAQVEQDKVLIMQTMKQQVTVPAAELHTLTPAQFIARLCPNLSFYFPIDGSLDLLTDAQWNIVTAVLSSFRSIDELSISYCNTGRLNPARWQLLLNLVALNNIKRVSIADDLSSISDLSLKAVARGLKQARKLSRLNLVYNQLNTLRVAQLDMLFSGIGHSNIQELTIAGNSFGKFTDEQSALVLRWIQRSKVTTLHLFDNQLNQYNAVQWEKFFFHLKGGHVKHINFGLNELHTMDADSWEALFANVPRDITLNLYSTNMQQIPDLVWNQLLGFIKQYGIIFLTYNDKDLDAKRQQELSAVLEENSKAPLYAAIDDMENYGLSIQKQNEKKGTMVYSLAIKLRKHVEDFYYHYNKDKSKLSIFILKSTIIDSLKEKDHAMRHYRTAWSTIVKNILVALTVVGAAVIAGNLIYTRARFGRGLFLFQQPHTTTEKKALSIQKAMEYLPSH